MTALRVREELLDYGYFPSGVSPRKRRDMKQESDDRVHGESTALRQAQTEKQPLLTFGRLVRLSRKMTECGKTSLYYHQWLKAATHLLKLSPLHSKL